MLAAGTLRTGSTPGGRRPLNSPSIKPRLDGAPRDGGDAAGGFFGPSRIPFTRRQKGCGLRGRNGCSPPLRRSVSVSPRQASYPVIGPRHFQLKMSSRPYPLAAIHKLLV